MTKLSNDNYLAADVANLTAHLEAITRDFPELADDPDLAADTFEGMGLNDLLARILGSAQDAKFMAAAVAERIGELKARQQRFERRNEAMRALMFRLLTAAGQAKVTLPEGTLSVSKGRDRVEVTDESSLPAEYVRVTTAPDKTALMAALKAGDVPGARIVPGEPSLSVRVA